MNRRLPVSALLVALALLVVSPARLSAFTVYLWTGVGTTGWQGDVTPPFDGTEDLILPKAFNPFILVPTGPATSVNSIRLLSNDDYGFQSVDVHSLLTVNTGIFGYSAGLGNKLVFDASIALTGGPSGLTLDAGGSELIIQGYVTGTTNVLLTNSVTHAAGTIVFGDNVTGNDYVGTTTIRGDPGLALAVSFWNSSPFGTGPVIIDATSTVLIAHNVDTVANDLFIIPSVANEPVAFRAWDGPLTLSGNVTLGNHTTLQARVSVHGFPSPDNSGTYPTPGPQSRNPIVFSGNIGEAVGPFSLKLVGPGLFVFQPTVANTYTGGTIVNGSVVFASPGAIPATGSVMVNASGYAGITDTTPGSFNAFLNQLDLGSTGSVGVDTLSFGQPAAALSINSDLMSFSNNANVTATPVTLTDAINLQRFNGPVSLGTATTAALAGTITPKGTDFLFGNGGGALYIQSDLTDVSVVTPSNVILSNLSPGPPLVLYLQGDQNILTQIGLSYTGMTIANNGFIIFDGVTMFSGGLGNLGTLVAGRDIANPDNTSNIGSSYIGFTNFTSVTSDRVNASVADLLGSFYQPDTWGIIGIDTHAGKPTVNIADPIDLTGFNNGVFLGTATSAIFSGPITPTADGVLRLTAALGGVLTVESTLADPATGGQLALSLGSPSPTTDVYSNGTVILTGPNTYTGGTTINSVVGGLTVEAGSDTAFGTGPLTLPQNVIAGLQVSAPFITLANPIVFQSPSPGNNPATLFITGGNNFELSGNLSGPGALNLMDGINNIDLTLSGDNSAFSGDITLFYAWLTLANNHAAGAGTVRFAEPNSTLAIDSLRAPAPILYGLSGVDGFIRLNDYDALTIDTSNPLNDYEFGGTIGNSLSPYATLTVTATAGGNNLYLYGSSNYSGGTSILDHATVAVGSSSTVVEGSVASGPLGTGPVTLNAPQGGLATNVGVTLNNDLNFIAGTLQGFGTFAPAAVGGVTGAPITFDTGRDVAPGLFGFGNHNSPGTLTLASDVVFANGGAMLWSLQDANRTDGYSTLNLNNLNITATSGQFILYVATLDGNGALGVAPSLTLGTPYSLPVVSATGSITGFDPASFTIDSSMFQGGTMSGTVFTLSQVNSGLFLNFTPVPEPSTYALLGLGLSAVLLPALRRRRRQL